MSNEKELNLKISAQSFEVKNLEIKDGRLELHLSAIIEDTSVEESTYDYEVKTHTSSEVTENIVLESTPLSPEIILDTATSAEEYSSGEVTVEDSRYGEPQDDIEWQAVNSDNAEISEIELDDEMIYPEEEPAPELKDIASNSISLQDEPVAEPTIEQPEEPRLNIPEESTIQLDSSPTESAEEPISHTPHESVNMEDEDDLPDYLKPAVPVSSPADVVKQTPAIPKDESIVDSNADDKPTVLFKRELPSKSQPQEEPTPEVHDEIMNAPETEINDKPTVQEPVLEQEPKRLKMVKFCCPRCKTPGSQEISTIGSIITCANCGRALKLNIKK